MWKIKEEKQKKKNFVLNRNDKRTLWKERDRERRSWIDAIFTEISWRERERERDEITEGNEQESLEIVTTSSQVQLRIREQNRSLSLSLLLLFFWQNCSSDIQNVLSLSLSLSLSLHFVSCSFMLRTPLPWEQKHELDSWSKRRRNPLFTFALSLTI